MAVERARTWLEQAGEWRRELTRELGALPQTLMQFREGIENFQRVTKRLSDATESMDQINQMQTSAIRALRDQLAAAPGSNMVAGAIDELSDAFVTLARLNPFWPRVPPKNDS